MMAHLKQQNSKPLEIKLPSEKPSTYQISLLQNYNILYKAVIMATQSNEEQQQSLQQQDSTVKFCPICGSTMHQQDYLNGKWWFCDDEECGFFEPV